VIYPWNRGGVWTIDEDDSFVPFGGPFPTNSFHDVFDQFPETGDVLGVNPHEGVFIIHEGETAFSVVYPAQGTALDAPRLWRYLPRMGGMVVLDRGGLRLIDHSLAVRELPFIAVPDHVAVSEPVDLPELNALVINVGGVVYLREDDGHATAIVTLEDWDFPIRAELLADQRVRIETHRRQYAVTLQRDHKGKVIGATSVAAPHSDAVPPARELTTSAGTYYWSDLVLWSGQPDMQRPMPLPFEAGYIASVEVHPVSRELMLFAEAGIFTLDAAAQWHLVPGSADVVSRVTSTLATMPDGYSLLLAGRGGLYLLVDVHGPSSTACLVGAIAP